MSKKVLLIALIAAIVLSAGCAPIVNVTPTEPASQPAQDTQQTDTKQSGPDMSKELRYDALFVISKDRVPDENSLLDQTLKEKFNIVMDWQIIPGTNVEEKINLLYASGEEPDLVWPVGVGEEQAKKLGMDGFLVPINEHFDKLPNYRRLFADDEWKMLLDFASNSDGNLYYIPQRNYRAASTAWIYRKSAFDEMGLSFPKNTDELYNVLKTIKAKYPDSIPMPNRSKNTGMMSGVANAMGISIAGSGDAYIDPKTGEFVPYSFSLDKYRELLKYYSKLYAEGLIDKEFPTVTDQIWTERYANGKTFIEYSYAERDTWAEQTMKDVDPNANWEWSRENISNDPDMFIYDREKPHVSSGSWFSKSMDAEKLDRVLALYDWLCTDEGILFMCMGKEGVTYEMKDGEPVFMSHMKTLDNPEGTPEWKYGLYLGNIAQHPAYIKSVGKEPNLVLTEALLNNPKAKYRPPIPWQYTVDEEKQNADLKTILKDISEEYFLKFVMGQLDPNDDNAWTEYKNTLEKAGLSDLIKLRTDAYARIKK